MLLDLKNLNSALKSAAFDTLSKLPSLDFSIDEVALFNIKNNYYRYQLNEQSLQKINSIPDSAENIEYHTASGNIAFTKLNNLFYAANEQTKAITKDGEGNRQRTDGSPQ